MPGRPRIEIAAELRAAEICRAIAADIRRIMEDASLTAAQLARAAHISEDTISAVLRGRRAPSFETLARISIALGAEISVRLTPGAGIAIRDHVQGRMAEGLIGDLHARWSPFAEVPVRTPGRGSIDLVLADTLDVGFVATEFQSQVRRPEQILRWSGEKAAALRTTELYAAARAARGEEAGDPWISRLLVVRSTPQNREVVRELGGLFAAAYPARTEEAVAALRTGSPWPGPAIAWMSVHGSTARLMDGPPRELRTIAR